MKKCNPRERNHVRAELAEIAIELTGEAHRARDAREAGRHQVVQVTVRRGRELQSSEANIIQGLVVEAEREVRVLDELVNRQGAVVWLDDRVANLRRRHNGVGAHHAVRVLPSRIFEMRRVPIPAPVPPPREWVIWKPWRQSQPSDSLRTTSSTESISSAPSV